MKIENLFQAYKSAMAKVGRKVDFPADTPREKTYLWRWLSTFERRVEDWGLDESAAIKMIRYAVDHAKQVGDLNRGASILNRDDILQICHNRLKEDLEHRSDIVQKLNKESKFVNSGLLDKPAGGYPNLVKWFQSGQVSSIFLSLSKKCSEAMRLMEPEDRAELPSSVELLKIRTRLLMDDSKIAVAMGDDLNCNGVPKISLEPA